MTEAAGRKALLDWYRAGSRDLPWRGERDPYRVLVSEVMLQQTQASRVVSHYQEFLGRFPTTADLAAAPFSEVVAAWSGLGYYTRSRRLQEAARVIEAGGWPTTIPGLRALPGVGPYTAAAVACFAFGANVPALDTNARRVLNRWRGRALSSAELQAAAAEELGDADAADWNQAVMDLGSLLCTPREPGCDRCPAQPRCAGPNVYEPPPRQSRYQGSLRQARAALLKELAREGADAGGLVTRTGMGSERVEQALAALATDGLAVQRGSVWQLAE